MAEVSLVRFIGRALSGTPEDEVSKKLTHLVSIKSTTLMFNLSIN